MARRSDRLLAAASVAKILDITTEAARKRIQRGQIPAVKFGREWRVKDSDLQAYIKNLHAGIAKDDNA